MISNNKLTLYVLSFLTWLVSNQCLMLLPAEICRLLDVFHLNELISFVIISIVNLGFCSWVILKSTSKDYRNWAFCLLWASSALFIMFSASSLTSLPLQNS